jgi:hypothetical protein
MTPEKKAAAAQHSAKVLAQLEAQLPRLVV